MTVATMTLRAARQRNVVLAVIGASMLVSLLLLSQTHSRLRRTEEDVEKCQQKHDSVAAQLTVLYEHKARLEKTLQAEIERKKAVDDELKTVQSALAKEKAIQLEKFAKLTRQFDELKSNENQEFSKLKATYESLRNDKEKLDAEVEELNIQTQKLREHNQKLEEEVRKMQQSEPIDMNEMERLRERVKQCDADQAGRTGRVAASAADEREAAVTSRPRDEIAGQVPVAASQGGDLNANGGGTFRANDSVGQGGAPDEMKADMAVLPVPQGRNSRASSSPRTVAAADAINVADAPVAAGEDNNINNNGGIIHVPLDSMQQVDGAVDRKSVLGHQFDSNNDHHQVPIFRQNANKPVEGEDRDYPENNKDDDAGADDGDEGAANDNKNNVDNKHQQHQQHQQQVNEDNEDNANAALEDVNNNNNAGGGDNDNPNVKINPDFDDPNVNVNDLESPRGVKVLPK